MSDVLRPYQVHVDDKVAALKNKPSARQQEESKQRRKLLQIANLAEHPGWQTIRQSFQEVIDAYRSGSVLSGQAMDTKVSNEEYGERARVAYQVAAELEKHLRIVDQALLTQEQLDEEAKDERAGRR